MKAMQAFDGNAVDRRGPSRPPSPPPETLGPMPRGNLQKYRWVLHELPRAMRPLGGGVPGFPQQKVKIILPALCTENLGVLSFSTKKTL